MVKLAARLGRFSIAVTAIVISLPVGTASATPAPPAKVVVVAVPGLTWADISARKTPNLWQFAQTAARGLLAVKSADAIATCADAMTTLGAGNRAKAPADLDALCSSAGTLPAGAWSRLRMVNRGQRYGARPGAMADALGARGLGVTPIGDAGAALASSRSDGSVSSGQPVVSVMLFGGLYRSANRAQSLLAIDSALSSTLAPSDTVTLVVGAGDDRKGRAGLRVAMASGGAFTAGRMVSDTTGRRPYVELVDVAPTVLSLFDIQQPTSMVGAPWRMATRGTALSADARSLVDMSRHASKRAYWGGRFVRFLVASGVFVCLAGIALLRLRRRSLSRVMEAVCYGVAALPVSSYALQVLPWWRWSMVIGGVVIGVVDVVIAGTAVILARQQLWRGVGVVATVTVVVLGLDLLTGTHLQLNGLLGDSAVIAGRFHGAGNTDSALFATAALVCIGFVAAAARVRGRAWAVGSVVVLGLVALVLEGAPRLGDDLGGVIALAPALAVLALLAFGVRLGARVWGVAIAVACLAGAALIGYDVVAGGGHIGRFAGQAGRSGAQVTIDRKLAANLSSWHRSDYVALVAFGLVALAVMARGPLRRAFAVTPLLGAGFVAVAVCAVVGAAVNDSGVVVPGAAMAIAVPLLLAGCLRSQQ